MSRQSLAEVCERLKMSATGIADATVLLLPENLESAPSTGELHDTPDSIELAKVFREQGLVCKTAYDLNASPCVKDRRGLDIWLGVIWFLNAIALPAAVGVLSNWLTTRFASCRLKEDADLPRKGMPTVHVEIRIGDREGMSTLQFDGELPTFLTLIAGLQKRDGRLL
jgi:hypothetical protein